MHMQKSTGAGKVERPWERKDVEPADPPAHLLRSGSELRDADTDEYLRTATYAEASDGFYADAGERVYERGGDWFVSAVIECVLEAGRPCRVWLSAEVDP